MPLSLTKKMFRMVPLYYKIALFASFSVHLIRPRSVSSSKTNKNPQDGFHTTVINRILAVDDKQSMMITMIKYLDCPFCVWPQASKLTIDILPICPR